MRVATRLWGSSQLLSMGLWMGCSRSFHQHRVPPLHSSQLWALRPKAAGIFGWKEENEPAAAGEGNGYTAGP